MSRGQWQYTDKSAHMWKLSNELQFRGKKDTTKFMAL